MDDSQIFTTMLSYRSRLAPSFWHGTGHLHRCCNISIPHPIQLVQTPDTSDFFASCNACSLPFQGVALASLTWVTTPFTNVYKSHPWALCASTPSVRIPVDTLHMNHPALITLTVLEPHVHWRDIGIPLVVSSSSLCQLGLSTAVALSAWAHPGCLLPAQCRTRRGLSHAQSSVEQEKHGFGADIPDEPHRDPHFHRYLMYGSHCHFRGFISILTSSPASTEWRGTWRGLLRDVQDSDVWDRYLVQKRIGSVVDFCKKSNV